MLFDGVVLKFDPPIVTVVPTGPDPGETEVMVGWASECSEKKTMINQKNRHFFYVLVHGDKIFS